MASVGTYIAEWFRHQLSSVATFQKEFVDDVSEKVKEQKAQFDRHTREANERAVQLHLDDLEEKYLCCVCGRGGEAREDDEFVYDTYSMISLPQRPALEAAVRDQLADVELSDDRIKQHQHMMAARQRRSQPNSSSATATYDNDSDSSSEGSRAASSRRTGSSGKERRRRHSRDEEGREKRAKSAPQRPKRHRTGRRRDGSRDAAKKSTRQTSGSGGGAAPAGARASISTDASPAAARTSVVAAHTTDLTVMDPDMVGPLDVRNTLYKIRHAVLHKEARVRRKSVAVHKDKGLMMIEESEIEMFSHFFQRPVHGYLCMACHTCARRRLDTLTQQIRAILFRAAHPVLRRLPAKELEALMSGNQVPPTLVQSILAVQRRATGLAEEQQQAEPHGTDGAAAAPQGAAAAMEVGERVGGSDESTATLSEKSILTLREEVKCGACQRRAACFFEPKSVVFLCQFCTARDRFYREHAVCINDEAMPLMLAHLLHNLAVYYQGVQQQMELRQAPLSAITEAQTDLFPLTEVMRDKEGLFTCQAPAAVNAHLLTRREVVDVKPALDGTAAMVPPHSDVPVAGPCTSAATTVSSAVTLAEQRERVGRTMVSLFDGVKVEGAGVNLFQSPAAPAPASPAVANLFESPTSPNTAPTAAPATGSDAIDHLFHNGSVARPAPGPAPVWGSGAAAEGAPATADATATPSADAAAAQNPDWDSLF